MSMWWRLLLVIAVFGFAEQVSALCTIDQAFLDYLNTNKVNTTGLIPLLNTQHQSTDIFLTCRKGLAFVNDKVQCIGSSWGRLEMPCSIKLSRRFADAGFTSGSFSANYAIDDNYGGTCYQSGPETDNYLLIALQTPSVINSIYVGTHPTNGSDTSQLIIKVRANTDDLLYPVNYFEGPGQNSAKYYFNCNFTGLANAFQINRVDGSELNICEMVAYANPIGCEITSEFINQLRLKNVDTTTLNNLTETYYMSTILNLTCLYDQPNQVTCLKVGTTYSWSELNTSCSSIPVGCNVSTDLLATLAQKNINTTNLISLENQRYYSTSLDLTCLFGVPTREKLQINCTFTNSRLIWSSLESQCSGDPVGCFVSTDLLTTLNQKNYNTTSLKPLENQVSDKTTIKLTCLFGVPPETRDLNCTYTNSSLKWTSMDYQCSSVPMGCEISTAFLANLEKNNVNTTDLKKLENTLHNSSTLDLTCLFFGNPLEKRQLNCTYTSGELIWSELKSKCSDPVGCLISSALLENLSQKKVNTKNLKILENTVYNSTTLNLTCLYGSPPELTKIDCTYQKSKLIWSDLQTKCIDPCLGRDCGYGGTCLPQIDGSYKCQCMNSSHNFVVSDLTSVCTMNCSISQRLFCSPYKCVEVKGDKTKCACNEARIHANWPYLFTSALLALQCMYLS